GQRLAPRPSPTDHAGGAGRKRCPRQLVDVRTRGCLRGRASALPGRCHQARRGGLVVPGELQAPAFRQGVDDYTVMPHQPDCPARWSITACKGPPCARPPCVSRRLPVYGYGATGGCTGPPITCAVVCTVVPVAARGCSQSSNAVKSLTVME